jgi:hypothetical protein
MRQLRWIGLALVLAVVGLGARESDVKQIDSDDIGRTVIVLGNLGRPLGEKMTIQGRKLTTEDGLKGDTTFEVQKIDGEALDRPRRVNIDGIGSWVRHQEATIVGYERGTIQFLYAEHTSLSLEAALKFTPRQRAFVEFVPYRVEAPDGTKLNAKLDDEPSN